MTLSIAIAQTATEAMSSPIITILTTRSACWNRSQIESDGATVGMASPPGRPILADVPRSRPRPRRPTRNGMPSGDAPPKTRNCGNRAGPHRWRYRFRAKGVQTRARSPRSPRRSRGLAGAAPVNNGLSQPVPKIAGPPIPCGNRRPVTAAWGKTSALRRRRMDVGRRVAARAPVGHELIELGLVLSHPQTGEEIAKLALLLFKTPQGFLAVFVEGALAARAHRRLPPRSCTRCAIRSVLPTADAVMLPAAHSSTPDDEGQGGNTHRPPDHEAQDRQGDPGRFSQFVDCNNDRHAGLAVNVNNIYIARRLPLPCQVEARYGGPIWEGVSGMP